MIISIYSVTNKINGMRYVGMSKDLPRRWKNHQNAVIGCPALYEAINEFGAENFVLTHHADCFSWNDAEEIERLFIKELNTKHPYGYNLTDGGIGSLGRKVSEKVMDRMKNNNPLHNPDVARKVSQKLKGKTFAHQVGENHVFFGKRGFDFHVTKYTIVAKNMITGEQKVLIGETSMKEAGFNPSHVYKCANKKRKTHKNHTFEFQGESS